jgi:hypothetical protein
MATSGAPETIFPRRQSPPSDRFPFAGAEVQFLTGGGAPSDATLEDALLGLRPVLVHSMPVRASGETPDGVTTAVLVLQGDQGLGSARFTLDLWALLAQAEAELATAGHLPPAASLAAAPWDPAGALAQALCVFGRIVLLSPGLAQHGEGDELRERLEACPALTPRLRLLAEPAELWPLLTSVQGQAPRVFAEPLGWRAACPRLVVCP